MDKFNQGHKAVLDDVLLGHPLVQPGKMFGFPAYYADGKLCICLYGQGVGVKLPEQLAAKLLQTDPNVVPFQPMGRRKMREWVQINLIRSEDYTRYIPLFDEAIRHVMTL